MDVFSGVCLSVCLFVRTITSERLNVGWWNLAVRCIAQKSRPNSTVKVNGQKSRSPGTKKGKTAESSPLTVHSKACAVGRTQQAATDDTIAWSPRGDWVTAVHAKGGYAGGKISACCLVIGCGCLLFIQNGLADAEKVLEEAMGTVSTSEDWQFNKLLSVTKNALLFTIRCLRRLRSVLSWFFCQTLCFVWVYCRQFFIMYLDGSCGYCYFSILLIVNNVLWYDTDRWDLPFYYYRYHVYRNEFRVNKILQRFCESFVGFEAGLLLKTYKGPSLTSFSLHHFCSRAQPRFQSWWVQFLGLGYCTEHNTDGIPSFVRCSLLRNGNHSSSK